MAAHSIEVRIRTDGIRLALIIDAFDWDGLESPIDGSVNPPPLGSG